MTKISYSIGIFLLVAGVVTIVQSISPTFLAQADTISIGASKGSAILAITGAIIFVFGFLIIILKIFKGRSHHGQKRY